MATMAGRGDLRRYSRHLLIPEVGLAGQERLSRARVLVIGAGGLGSPVLAYLAAAGVGRIVVVDDDTVDVTNLQRQILYDTADVGAPKAHRAAERLRALNPQIAIDALTVRFDAGNARELVRLVDVVVDGISSTTRACSKASPTCTARSFASTVSCRCSPRRTGRAIAVCIPSRRPKSSCRRAARAACSACWREWSARSKRTKRSS
jgi:adenylyltransferase/sulfurtransferase